MYPHLATLFLEKERDVVFYRHNERKYRNKQLHKARKTLNGTALMQVVWGFVFRPLYCRTTTEIATSKLLYKLGKLGMLGR